MYFRRVSNLFLQSVKTFPVVILTGARQTGKSTLCQTLLKSSHLELWEDIRVKIF